MAIDCGTVKRHHAFVVADVAGDEGKRKGDNVGNRMMPTLVVDRARVSARKWLLSRYVQACTPFNKHQCHLDVTKTRSRVHGCALCMGRLRKRSHAGV